MLCGCLGQWTLMELTDAQVHLYIYDTSGWQTHQVGDLMTAFYLLLCCVDYVHRRFLSSTQQPSTGKGSIADENLSQTLVSYFDGLHYLSYCFKITKSISPESKRLANKMPPQLNPVLS